MDQIFDRLERLVKSWTTPDDEEPLAGRRSSARGSGDPDLDAAMSELDDYLDKDREAAEARQKERERRERAAKAQAEAERAARGGYRQGMGASRPSGPPEEVVAAYRTLGLPFGATAPQVKAAYKKLLMQYHPDRNSDTPEKLRRATEISANINAAYQRIETWTATGA